MRKNPITMKGRIDRCWLFTFQASEEEARAILPKPLVPVTRDGCAFWNVVVCRVGAMRPRGVPGFLGMGYWHVAYRLYARFRPAVGGPIEGLYFVRSDCDSGLMAWMGNLVTDFNFHKATIDVREDREWLRVTVDAPGATADATLRRGAEARLSKHSVFASIEEASSFLKYKPCAFSVLEDGRVNVVRIERDEAAWRGRPVEVVHQEWAFFGGRPVAPEICTEVEPIAYRWNRGEVVEPRLRDEGAASAGQAC
jgi:uncharacterized protein DUF2071